MQLDRPPIEGASTTPESVLHASQRAAIRARDVAERARGVADHTQRHVQRVTGLLTDLRRAQTPPPPLSDRNHAERRAGPDRQAELVLAGYETAPDRPHHSAGGRELALLTSLVHLDRRVRQRIDELVDACRQDGATWAEIAAALGTTRQAAHERFGRRSGPRRSWSRASPKP
jgi:hypothetical protein